MAKRGKVLRDPLDGPGLLMAEGRQYPFFLDGLWKSDVPPKPGLPVDLDFNTQGHLVGITAISDSEIAREKAENTRDEAKNLSWSMAALIVRFHIPQLIALALLVLSWFVLTAVSIEVPLTGTLELSLWQLLHLVTSDKILQGVCGLLAGIAIAGPFFHYVLKKRRAVLAGFFPLAFMLLVGALLFSHLHSVALNGLDGPYRQLTKHVQQELISAISLGPGTYLSMITGTYFAVVSVREFRKSKGIEDRVIERPQRAAA